MSVGAHSETEHECHERMTSQVEPGTDGDRKTYRGSVEYDSDDSIGALLEQFKRMKSDD